LQARGAAQPGAAGAADDGDDEPRAQRRVKMVTAPVTEAKTTVATTVLIGDNVKTMVFAFSHRR